MIVGLTGGIASGKSTVLNILRDLGALTIDADEISKELTAPNGNALSAIESTFGKEYFYSDGSLNRSKLGQLVFNDVQAKQRLEEILHPKIMARIDELIVCYREKHPQKVIVVDIPLLFEIDKQDDFNEIWVVWVDYQTQIDRLINRNGLSKEGARSRLEAQISLDEKASLADRIIDNSKSIAETKEQVKQNYHLLVNKISD